MKKWLFILLLPVAAFGQERTEVDIREILDDWVLSNDSILTYSDLLLDVTPLAAYKKYDFQDGIVQYLDSVHRDIIQKDSLDRVVIPKEIWFSNIATDSLVFRNLSIQGLIIKDSEINYLLEVDSSNVSLMIENTHGRDLIISRNEINGMINEGNEFENFWLSDNVIGDFSIIGTFDYLGILHNISKKFRTHLRSNDAVIRLYNKDRWIKVIKSNGLVFNDSLVADYPIQWGEALDGTDFNQTLLEGDIGKLEMGKNLLNGQVLLDGRISSMNLYQNTVTYLNVSSETEFENVEMYGNRFLIGIEFQKRLIESIYFINWGDIRNKIVVNRNDTFYHPTHPTVLSDLFLTNQNYRFLRSAIESYRREGLINEANEAYIFFKDIETDYLRYWYNQDPKIETLIRLVLARILDIYVDYGTNPAKAIVISIYIILLFSLFYLFFPSEWDVASKAKLLRDFRDFVERNEKGYFKPFLKMSAGFIISFFNALTLSVNSFVTLGFGTIPTKGLARYVCVLQGLLGWFLLSIFTVALINQVMM